VVFLKMLDAIVSPVFLQAVAAELSPYAEKAATVQAESMELIGTKASFGGRPRTAVAAQRASTITMKMLAIRLALYPAVPGSTSA
jgi:hypothetical protein